jgi:Glycosyltransferase sugar-binding region containing DXD motif
VANADLCRPPREAIRDIFQILIRDDQNLPTELPVLVDSAVQSVRSEHPEAAHHLLSGNDVRSFIAAHFESDVVAAYDLLTPYTYKADLARYCLLFIHGGLYIDLGIRFLTRLEPPLGTGLVAFRDCSMLNRGWGSLVVATSVIYASAGRPELRTAINLIVQNCRDRYYGTIPLDPTGPGLLGRAIAICNNGFDYWIGDCRTTTPEFENKNIVFATPDGELLALRAKRGNIDEIVRDGTNKYADLWCLRQVYGERERAKFFGITTMCTQAATKAQDSFLIGGNSRGCAIYGPYIPLPAGRYRINLWFDPDTKLGSSTLDVCSSAGDDMVTLRVLEAGEFEMDPEGRVGFEFETASNLQNVQVRMHVSGDCEGRFHKLEIV